MKNIMKTLTLSAAASTVVMAGAYKLPENSINSMALSAAYVAHTMGADTAHFNPANMAFMEDNYYFEGALTLVRLPFQEYNLIDPYSGESKTENILVPGMHFVSKAMGDFRWGMNVNVPGGLTKRWDTPFQKAFAEEFTLKIVELNPSFSYKLSENFAVGGGVSLIYSEGVVKNDTTDANAIDPRFPLMVVNMKGDTVEFGYNLAMTYRPTEDIALAATYRSNVDLNEEGTATINGTPYNASVSVPLPAALNLAVSKTWNDTFTLELNYERVFWSKYKNLEFKGTPLPVSPKNWEDSNVYRIGATIAVNEKLTAMFGFAIDETPIPLETLGFELADSDAKVFSMGFRYQQTENLSWGAAFLYDDKEPISMPLGLNERIPAGSFHEGGAFLTTIGMAYEF